MVAGRVHRLICMHMRKGQRRLANREPAKPRWRHHRPRDTAKTGSPAGRCVFPRPNVFWREHLSKRHMHHQIGHAIDAQQARIVLGIY